MLKNKTAHLYLIFLFALLYAPIFFLVLYSFNAGTTMQGWQGFTWSHYQELFSDYHLIEIVLDTLVLALLSALIATTVGTVGALLINRQKNRIWKNTLLSLNNVLLVSPDVIIGASLLILFTVCGFSLGFISTLFAHIAFSIPIVVLMILPRLQEMSHSLIDAAKDLGANDQQVLSQVTLPYISPGILAGFFMAFTYSLDDFAVTFFVTGNGFTTLSVEIYSRARQGVSLEINALSTIMFLVSIILVLFYYFINQRANRQRKNKLTKMVLPGERE
ncbi:ABC transporter permease [Convivina intestini]|uniref:ABC transporter permease n=1 Tax=Convivina intestini TaxID=1505726 RepID=UPI00200D7130|nr:ABC transporter permease [Convivina intestini]CAH1854184.1 Inner membrane ABC transporter permease protein YdcV [Convivina intestini]